MKIIIKTVPGSCMLTHLIIFVDLDLVRILMYEVLYDSFVILPLWLSLNVQSRNKTNTKI